MTAPVQNGSEKPDAGLTRKALLAFLNTEPAKAAIVPMLPKGQSYERIIREVMNATADNADILKCTIDSIVQAISRAVTWDLEIGTGAFLVPRKDRASDTKPRLRAQIGYLGKIELMLRFHAAKFIDYHCRYENEHYRCEYGTNPFIEHRPITDPEKRGALVGGYAFAQMTQVHSIIVEMHRDEVDSIRQQFSQQWKTKWERGQKVPLPLDEIPWYVEARCVHRLAKKVPMRGVLASLLSDGDADGLVEGEEVGRVVHREIGAGAVEPIPVHGSGPGLGDLEPVAAHHTDHDPEF